MYTEDELKTIKSSLISSKQRSESVLDRRYYDGLISKTEKLIRVNNMQKNSRGFTAEESQMHSDMIKDRSVFVKKLYDLEGSKLPTINDRLDHTMNKIRLIDEEEKTVRNEMMEDKMNS